MHHNIHACILKFNIVSFSTFIFQTKQKLTTKLIRFFIADIKQNLVLEVNQSKFTGNIDPSPIGIRWRANRVPNGLIVVVVVVVLCVFEAMFGNTMFIMAPNAYFCNNFVIVSNSHEIIVSLFFFVIFVY